MASDTDRDLGGPEVIEPAQAPAALRTRRGDVDLDGLARLEGERRFLLRSLNDLEREYEAGDVDQADYVALKDGYTARAAVTLRAIERGRAILPATRRTSAARVALWVVGILVVACLAGWGLARSSGTRLPGETITGGLPADEVALALTETAPAVATVPSTVRSVPVPLAMVKVWPVFTVICPPELTTSWSAVTDAATVTVWVLRTVMVLAAVVGVRVASNQVVLS